MLKIDEERWATLADLNESNTVEPRRENVGAKILDARLIRIRREREPGQRSQKQNLGWAVLSELDYGDAREFRS